MTAYVVAALMETGITTEVRELPLFHDGSCLSSVPLNHLSANLFTQISGICVKSAFLLRKMMDVLAENQQFFFRLRDG